MRYKINKTKSKLNFSEQFFPARPRKLIKRVTKKIIYKPININRFGPAIGRNYNYIHWLERESMLNQANKTARKYSAQGSMWQHPFAKPRPQRAINMASVWFTAYGFSITTKENQSIISSLGDDNLWQMFNLIGIDAIHTGPVKMAGGIIGWNNTPSIDGHFDRISTKIDPIFGYEHEFKAMTATAHKYGGIIIDDIIPGHTGKGYDFKLAEFNHKDYPGIYHMVEINPSDWSILPEVPTNRESVNIDIATEQELKKRGYIIGKLQRVIFFEPGIKETNWSVTKPIKGTDGIVRRWVYLHYFKEGQPSINWLDPSFAGMKLVIGDALHSLGDLGSSGLRLDANGFLGAEKSDEDQPAWSEGHPLSEAANMLIAGMVRKVGGFTFQELNLSIEDIKAMSSIGADLSYDFISRPAYHHALVTGDTEFLRIMLRSARALGVKPISLVHALQNHDDLTFELVHLWTVHKDENYIFRGKLMTGLELRELIRSELTDKLTGKNAPYNLLFTTNGISCTTVSLITAILGIKDLNDINDEHISLIKRMHLLLTMFNALQPGAFALSGWDLCGSLPLDKEQIIQLIGSDEDNRWISRGGYDLLGYQTAYNQTSAGLPMAKALYGPINKQLMDEQSYVSQLQQIIKIRKQFNIDTSEQIEIMDISNQALLGLIHQLNQDDQIQVTVLNFSNQALKTTLKSDFFIAKNQVTNMMTNESLASVSEDHSFTLSLEAYEGLSLLIS